MSFQIILNFNEYLKMYAQYNDNKTLGNKLKARPVLRILAISILMGSASHAGAFGFDKDVEDALKFGQQDGKYGQVKFDLLYRWENVDQERNPLILNQNRFPTHTANANTLRLKLGYMTPEFHGLQGYVEYAGNYVLQSDYNNGLGNKPEFPTVGDPDRNELNQLWISYSGLPGTVIKGGRQIIKFDDQRFLAPVAWRQLDQTMDAVLITYHNKDFSDFTLNVGYIGNVLTVLSTTENINAPIINANYKVGNYGNLVGYGYWLGYTERENFSKSNQTYGLRFSGVSPKFNEHYNFVYTAEWSVQKDYLNGLADYQADRINLIGGFTAYNFTFQGSMEQQNGYGPNKRFITPLGLNHAFQGWADLFLTTPDNGIRDVFGSVTGEFYDKSLSMIFAYHDFTDDTGGIHYGDEINASVLKKFGKHYSLLAKYAYYDADQFANDTQRIWLQADVNF